MSDRLFKINIPEARKTILKSIAEFRLQAQLAGVVEAFFSALDPTKKITKLVADKLHAKLIEAGIKVGYVRYMASTKLGIEWTFNIKVYDLEQDRTFTLRYHSATEAALAGVPALFDIDDMMIADRRWTAEADFLEKQLETFPYAARKFNSLIDELAELVKFAAVPGQHYPVFPLSAHFHWYALHDAGRPV